MTIKERLHQLVEELPEERAGEWLRRIETEMQETSETRSDSKRGLSDAFLATFGAWKDDPRTTEEIMEEIRSARTPNREIEL